MEDMWEGVRMRVPPLPPTNLAGSCSIITVQVRNRKVVSEVFEQTPTK